MTRSRGRLWRGEPEHEECVRQERGAECNWGTEKKAHCAFSNVQNEGEARAEAGEVSGGQGQNEARAVFAYTVPYLTMIGSL